MGDVRIRTGDPFGILERQRTFDDGLELLVYPRVVPLRRLALRLRHPSLDVASVSSPVTDPTRTATVRDYRPDDPRRMIHWPTSARRGGLQVRVLEPATSLHVSLLIDMQGFAFGIYRAELLELTLSAIASVAVYLQNKDAPVGLIANADPPLVVPPGASVPHLQHLLESLARLKPRAAGTLLPWALQELPRGNTTVLAMSDASPDLGRAAHQLEEAGFSTVLLLATLGGANGYLRPGTVIIERGCDVGARLEGRG
jgi:uncharacterized protein (DUF58 family)